MASLTLGQSYDSHSLSEAALLDIVKMIEYQTITKHASAFRHIFR